MKNTSGIKIDERSTVRFYPRRDRNTAMVSGWPRKLRKKTQKKGVYSVHRVEKPSARSVKVVIKRSTYGSGNCPTYFTETSYGLCRRFVRELGIVLPEGRRRKALHLIVTRKRRKG